MSVSPVPVSTEDPMNAAILTVSEDGLKGFQRDPFGEISRRSGLELATVIERIRAMLAAGTIRRVRQTLLSNKLAEGALVAWAVPQERLHAAFDYMFERDPFSGHVVIRTTDVDSAGSAYRLWTTLKVPQGFSLEKHVQLLARETGAERHRIMPARCLFALGVGHVRRRGLEPGSRADKPAGVIDVNAEELSELEWRVITAINREFALEEIHQEVWQARADEAGLSLVEFFQIAESLDTRGLIGRFSTFLEHVKPLLEGERVTRYNALFHWAVEPGRELDAGREVGRHHVLTHAYWREAGPEFHNVNIMAVAHGTDKGWLLEHKAAIDTHLLAAGLGVSYTNVFWGGRSEIKPSDISPLIYQEWCAAKGIDPQSMR